jgi:DNA polymerase beta
VWRDAAYWARITYKKALELINKYGINTISDLKKISSLLPMQIQISLKYYNDIDKKIPRYEMTTIDKYLQSMIKKMDGLHGIVCGSYRRMMDSSNDIDLLLIHDKIKTKKQIAESTYLMKFVDVLIKDGFIVDSLTKNHVTKFMGFCKLGANVRRIDIRFVPTESYYAALLYFTGNANFNKYMRIVAIKQDYKLSEYGLFDKNNKMINIKNEQHVFELLKIPVLEPKLRNY